MHGVVFNIFFVVISWSSPLAMALPDGITPLKGIEGNLPDDDLRPIDDVVGNAKYVGLGEGAHGSGGFHKAQIRVIKYLVEKRGFRAVTFETPWRLADIASRYVDTCQGNPV